MVESTSKSQNLDDLLTSGGASSSSATDATTALEGLDLGGKTHEEAAAE